MNNNTNYRRRRYRESVEELKQRQRRILNRLSATNDYGLRDTERDEIGELSSYDNHPADIASELFEREKDVSLRDNDRIELNAIQHALGAIDQGTYGYCEECGCEIPSARLEAVPTATLCTHCKDTAERQHPDRMRPVEEEYLYPVYARSDLDDTTAVEFDGEDAWQAVARYNERPEFQTDAEQIQLDDNEGLVEPTDGISNELYQRGRMS